MNSLLQICKDAADVIGLQRPTLIVGSTNYTPNGWASVPNGEQRYMEGFARHMLAVGRGERIDNGPGGTGCLHKAQMIWNLLASLELELRREAAWDGRKA